LLRSDVDLVNKGAAFAIEYAGSESVIDVYKKRAEKAEKYEIELKKRIDNILSLLNNKVTNWVMDQFNEIKKEIT
jgi:hypothetical protein